MKMKAILVLLCVAMMLGSVPVQVLASEEVIVDETTGVSYTLLFSPVHVQGQYAIEDASSGDTRRQLYFWEYVDGDLGSMQHPDVQNCIAECKQEAETEIQQMSAGTHQMNCHLRNQRVYQVPQDRLSIYYSFFGIDETFSGTQVFEKNGIPITVTGDGSGALTLQIDCIMQGYGSKIFFVPGEKIYECAEEIVQDYAVWITLKETGKRDIFHFGSLEELLTYCAEYAVLDAPLEITGNASCHIQYTGTLLPNYLVELEYGNDVVQTSTSAPITIHTSVTRTETTVKTTAQSTTTAAKTTSVNSDTVDTSAYAETSARTTISGTNTTSTEKTTTATVITSTASSTTTKPSSVTTVTTASPSTDKPKNVWISWLVFGCVTVLVLSGSIIWYLKFYRAKIE